MLLISNKNNIFSMGVIEIISNVIGTIGFFIGSFLWVIEYASIGTVIFAISCVFCGIACTIYSFKFLQLRDYVGAFALLQQAAGCLIFTIASVALLIDPHDDTAVLLSFFTASLLFLTGCLLTQAQCQSLTGAMAPLLPSLKWDVLPTSLLNTIGSLFFTVGSIALFYSPSGDIIGAWGYTIGSFVFVLASWGDATLWRILGLTQTEHKEVISSSEMNYAQIKLH